jgi:hypothetical protein
MCATLDFQIARWSKIVVVQEVAVHHLELLLSASVPCVPFSKSLLIGIDISKDSIKLLM